MSIKRDHIIVVSVVGVFLLLFLWYLFYSNRLGDERYKLFRQAEVSGRILKLHPGKGVFHVKLMGEGGEWWFYPAVPKDEDYPNFGSIAKEGDSIVKHAKSDTIYLFSEDQVYRYLYLR